MPCEEAFHSLPLRQRRSTPYDPIWEAAAAGAGATAALAAPGRNQDLRTGAAAAGAVAMATEACTHPAQQKHPPPLGRAAPWQQQRAPATIDARRGGARGHWAPSQRGWRASTAALAERSQRRGGCGSAALPRGHPQPPPARARAPRSSPDARRRRRAALSISPHAWRMRSASPTSPSSNTSAPWQQSQPRQKPTRASKGQG